MLDLGLNSIGGQAFCSVLALANKTLFSSRILAGAKINIFITHFAKKRLKLGSNSIGTQAFCSVLALAKNNMFIEDFGRRKNQYVFKYFAKQGSIWGPIP